MPPRVLSENLLAEVEALRAEVERLKLAGRPIRVDVRDGSNVLRVRLGDIDGAGRYGLRVWSAAGGLVHDYTAT